jgi:hypothetical protein
MERQIAGEVLAIVTQTHGPKQKPIVRVLERGKQTSQLGQVSEKAEKKTKCLV